VNLGVNRRFSKLGGQEFRDKISCLGIVLEDLIERSVHLRFLREADDELLKIHLALTKKQLDSSSVRDVTIKYKINLQKTVYLFLANSFLITWR